MSREEIDELVSVAAKNYGALWAIYLADREFFLRLAETHTDDTVDFLKAIEIWKGRFFAAETEIERLRDNLKARELEIARLRRSLSALLEDPPATLDEPDEDWEVIVKMRAIASEALTGPVGGPSNG